MRWLIALLVPALVLAACGGGSGGQPAATAPSTTAAPVSTAAAVVDDRRSGIPALDAALDALFSGDRAAVASLIAFTPTDCMAEPPGLGSPPMCPEGIADGTTIDVFPASNCHGYYVFPEDMDNKVDTMTARGAELYEVYEVSDSYPPGTHAAVYTGAIADARPDDAYVVFITRGRITGYKSGCSTTPADFGARRPVETRLVPPPTPAADRTGLLVADGILDAIGEGDAEALDRLVQFMPVRCSATPEGFGAPPLCREGEEPGTIVAAFPVQTCEFEYQRRDELGSLMDHVAGGRPHGVYDSGSGNYWVVYEVDTPSGPRGVGLLVEGSTITALETTCGGGVEQLLEFHGLGESLVEPAKPEQEDR